MVGFLGSEAAKSPVGQSIITPPHPVITMTLPRRSINAVSTSPDGPFPNLKTLEHVY